MLTRTLCAATTAMLSLMVAQVAGAVTIDFEGLVHGQVVSGTTISGVTIGVNNLRQDPDYADIFDTTIDAADTKDPDLVAGTPAWSGGNLSQDFLGYDPQLGNILIVQRGGAGCDTGICDRPNDQGGGVTSLDFVFATPIVSFGWDLVDIESAESGGQIVLHDGANSVSFIFGDLIGAQFFGNHTANHFVPLVASQIGLGTIDRVTIEFGGSGGIDNLVFEPVPEPSTVALVALGLLGIAGAGRRARRQP